MSLTAIGLRRVLSTLAPRMHLDEMHLSFINLHLEAIILHD